MRTWIYIALGGAIGSLLRYLTSILTLKIVGPSWLITGTTVVNVTGCFLIGLVFQILETHELLDSSLKLFLIVGLLGGFTTFSSFGLEGFDVFKQSIQQGLLYMGIQIISGLTAVWLGIVAGKWIY